MNNKGKGGKTNGILARGRAIRDENEQLPLISPDRNEPCPFSLTAQRQKRPKYALQYALAFVIQNIHISRGIICLC